MVSLITEKLRKQLLEDDGTGAKTEAKTEAKMEARKEEQPKGAENHSVKKSVTHLLQLSPSTHSDVLKSQLQPEGNLCHCSSWEEVDHNKIQSSKQSEKTVRECEKCQPCPSSPEVSPNQAKKRQCHMMSSPDETDQSPWRRGWRPQQTGVWRPIGPSPDRSRRAVLGCQARPDLAVPVPHGEWKQSAEPRQRLSNSSESPSPVLRPSSALSGTLDGFCNPMSGAVGHWPGSTFSPSLSAFSLTGLSLEEVSCSSFQPQRCHSQPSVLLERRGFKKRRRDEKRPNLNFIKMKETAYAKRHQSYGRARNIVHLLENTNSLQLKELDCCNQSRLFYSLDTIASSPQELIFSPASVSLSGECLTSKSGSQVDSDDQSTYKESLDSGCSGDSALHLESESLNDLHTTRCKQLNKGIEEEEEEVFEINVLDDLDIDEIEKD